VDKGRRTQTRGEWGTLLLKTSYGHGKKNHKLSKWGSDILTGRKSALSKGHVREGHGGIL